MDIVTVLIAGLGCFLLIAPILDRLGLGPGLALAITALLAAWLADSGADAEMLRFTEIQSLPRWIAVLLVPWVFRHGVELGSMCRNRFSVSELASAGARVAIAILFVASLVYLRFPWGSWRQPEPGPDRWLASLLLAAAWAIPSTTLRLTRSGSTRLEARHGDQGLWGVLLGILAFSALLIGFRSVSTDAAGALSTSTEGPLRGAVIPAILAVASGIVAGVLGSFLGRVARTPAARIFTDLAVGYLALLLAGLVSGAEILAPLFAGATRGFSSPAADPAESDVPGFFWRPVGTLTMGLVFVLGADAVSHSLFDTEVISLALTLWAAGLVVQALGSGALLMLPRRGGFRTSWNASLALGWAYHPGALAVGLASTGDLLTNDALPERLPATFFAVVLAGSLLQGAIAPLLFRLFRPAQRASWNRWREQDGFRVALSACFRELDRLQANGLVGDEQGESIRRALQGELRALDLERSDALSRSPELERARWTHALELLLASAGAAVARAAESGQLPPATAAHVRRRLARRMDRLSELSVEEILRRPARDGGQEHEHEQDGSALRE